MRIEKVERTEMAGWQFSHILLFLLLFISATLCLGGNTSHVEDENGLYVVGTIKTTGGGENGNANRNDFEDPSYVNQDYYDDSYEDIYDSTEGNFPNIRPNSRCKPDLLVAS